MIAAMKSLVHSKATTASRQSVLAALARFSDRRGGNAHPSVDTLMRYSRAARATVAAALAEALENGDIVRTGQLPSGTWIYSFAPLIERASRSSASEPCADGSVTKPSKSDSSITGDHSSITGDHSSITGDHSSASEPDEVEEVVVNKREENYFSQKQELRTAAQRNRWQAERADDRATLRALRAQLATSRHPARTREAIAALERELGLASEDPAIQCQLDSWAGRLGEQLERMAVAA